MGPRAPRGGPVGLTAPAAGQPRGPQRRLRQGGRVSQLGRTRSAGRGVKAGRVVGGAGAGGGGGRGGAAAVGAGRRGGGETGAVVVSCHPDDELQRGGVPRLVRDNGLLIFRHLPCLRRASRCRPRSWT